jgi:N12 class adenine-specific DNA methylase
MTLEELEARIHGNLEELEARIHGDFERLELRVREAFEARIRDEGDVTRRHFEAVTERIEASVRIIAEGHAHLRTIVGNHEVRLQSLEKRT